MATLTVAIPATGDATSTMQTARAVLPSLPEDAEVVIAAFGEPVDVGDERVRCVRATRPGFASAMNVAAGDARSDFVAIVMPGDEIDAQRLSLQLAYIREHPAVGTVFCGWTNRGEAVQPECPSGEAGALRWRLMLGPIAPPGTAMFRRIDAQAVGGFDERVTAGADYDLWLRLVERCSIAALPQTLVSTSHPKYALDDGAELAPDTVAWLMVRAWASIPAAHSASRAELVRDLARLGAGERASVVLTSLEDGLACDGASVEGLLAWLWASWTTGSPDARALRSSRNARLREVIGHARTAGAHSLWLFGDESLTWVLAAARATSMEITGVVEHAGDAPGGLRNVGIDALGGHEHVLICDAAREDELFAQSQRARAAGVRVWRLYGEA